VHLLSVENVDRMAAVAPTQIFRSDFIRTEINHDLNGPLSIALNKVLQTKLNRNTGACQSLVDRPIYNDSDIVKAIIGLTSDQIRDLPSNTENTINVRCGSAIIPTTCDSAMQPATIKKYNKPYNNSLLNLFPHRENFFIIDTGDNLVQTIKGLTIPPENPFTVHVIHSMATLGDSAPKTLPDSPNYNIDGLPNVRIYSWYLSRPYQINIRNNLFMTSFNIALSKTGGPTGWKISQRWTGQNPAGAGVVEHLNTPDSKKDNSKPMIKKFLSANMSQIRNRPDTHDIITRTNVKTQQKCSGDHLQIVATYDFPKIATGAVNTTADLAPAAPAGAAPYTDSIRDLIFVRGPAGGHTTSAAAFATPHDEAWYKARTYFITGDWPAFAYAAYNRINAIIIFKHPTDQALSCTIRIQFP